MPMHDFNGRSEGARYFYARSPVSMHSFQILKFLHGMTGGDAIPVGEYTVLDLSEDEKISEKKVINMVSLLNGHHDLIYLGHETHARTLYQVLSECDEDGKVRILFYHLGNEGVSVENALFRLDRGEHVWH
jgi:hypothetical protein